jgi:hypothetical protein
VIKQVEFYHGAVLARLVRGRISQGVTIRAYEAGRSGYILNESIGLYVKYSANRLTPWSFNFSSEHQEEISNLKSECTTLFVALVCGEDGIACLSQLEYRALLDDQFESTGWIKVSRRTREKYLLTGSDAQRKFKVGDNEFPSKVHEALGL